MLSLKEPRQALTNVGELLRLAESDFSKVIFICLDFLRFTISKIKENVSNILSIR